METKLEEDKSVPLYLGKSGLGGWLIVFQISFYASLIGSLVAILFIYLPVFLVDEYLPQLSSPYVMPLLITEFIFQILISIFMVYVLINFYQKKQITPTLLIILYVTFIVFSVADTTLASIIFEEMTELSSTVRNVLTSIIWILYIKRSERVQNTFVR